MINYSEIIFPNKTLNRNKREQIYRTEGLDPILLHIDSGPPRHIEGWNAQLSTTWP